MQKHVFGFQGRRIELWTHPEPDHLNSFITRNQSFYELDVLMKCRERYLPGTAIIDVGANIGNHSVFYAAILGATVYAFEPDQRSYDLLELNIVANDLEGKIVTECCGIGAQDGIGSLHAGTPHSGTARVTFGDGDLPVRSLGSLASADPISIVKIDVEGTESAVLQGSAALIEAWQPDFIVEVEHPHELPPVLDIMLRFGYTPLGRYAATPTYLFTAIDQASRIRRLLSALGPAVP